MIAPTNVRSYFVILYSKGDHSPNCDRNDELFNSREFFFVSIFDDVHVVNCIEQRFAAYNADHCVIRVDQCHPVFLCEPTNRIIDLTTGCDLGRIDVTDGFLWESWSEDYSTKFVAWVYDLK